MALVVLLVGATGTTSRAHALTRYVAECLDSYGHTTLIVDPGQAPAEVLIAGDSSAPSAREIAATVEAADAVIPVTPVRNGSFSAALKAVLDLLPPGAFADKTVMPVGTGGTSSHLTGLEYSLHPVIADLGGRHILRGAYVLDSDLEVHGCGAALAPQADDALRLVLAGLSAALGGGVRSRDDDALLVAAEDALALRDAGALLLDVRRADDRGHTIRGVVHVEKIDVPTLFEPNSVPALGIRAARSIVVFCNREKGSLRVVQMLQEFGYTDVRHVRGAAAALDDAQQNRAHAYLG
ncbi:MAG: NAD(P)H-dependent oxidoreductase [Mycobacterium sp.]